jgi:AraC family transcriptional regulator
MVYKFPPGFAHGKVSASCEVNGLGLSEIIYPANYRTPRHSHESSYFVFVRHGSFVQTYGGRTREHPTLDLLYMRPDEVHAHRFDRAGAQCFNVEIGRSWIERLHLDFTLSHDSVDFCGGLPAWLAARLYREFKKPDSVSAFAIDGLALELFAEVSRRPSTIKERKAPAWLTLARDLLHANFSVGLTIEEIARSAGVHPVHLARAFRNHYQFTIGDYVRRLRLEFACREMIASSAPLTEIALRAGFYDHSHFSKVFKQWTSLTPSEYRAAFRRGKLSS